MSAAVKIPDTDSIEELARFWATHDLTDFEDQLEEVSEPVFDRPADQRLEVRLATDQVEAVDRLAAERGTDAESLVRSWILEKLAPSEA